MVRRDDVETLIEMAIVRSEQACEALGLADAAAADVRSFLSEVDVASDPRLAGTVDQSDQSGPLGAPASSANENDNSVVWFGLSQFQEVVAIAADDDTSISRGIFKNLAILS